jgi:hypothetical protein
MFYQVTPGAERSAPSFVVRSHDPRFSQPSIIQLCSYPTVDPTEQEREVYIDRRFRR